MNRIEKKFKELNGKTAFIGYITSGDPSIEKTEEMVYEMEKNGCDIIELGIPYSDPVADGPTIQAAAKRALDNGTRVADVFELIKNIRKNSEVPLAFLLYFNTVFAYGVEKFVKKCDEIGIDGLIIPDLPLEEREEIAPYLKESNVGLIPLVAPNSKERIKPICDGGRGFVYCISSFGVTGMRDSFEIDIKSYLDEVREQTELPLAVGFGISTNEDVKKFAKIADGVIVGSAIVKEVEKSNGDAKAIGAKIKALVK